MSSFGQFSRRGFVAGVGSVVAASANVADAQPHAADLETVTNPVSEYPPAGFPVQHQDWPGLESRMQPVPDAGEQSYKGRGQLPGRKALITGGDSGIGRAVAIAMAREGADVAINYLPQEEPDAREVVGFIRAAGRKAVAIPGDLKSLEFCNRLVDEATRQLGGLDILVHNAARQIYHADSILSIGDAEFDEVYKTNVYAMFRLAKAAIPHMQPGSVILYTSSEQAYDPDAEILHYASTKAAIANFTKGLAKGLVKQGIRVNAVAPGPIWTPLQVTGGTDPQKIPQFGTTVAYKRAGQPVELAPAYVFLASQAASYCTGQIVGVNGGKGVPG